MIRQTFGVQVVGHDDRITLSGDRDQLDKAAAVFDHLQKALRRQDWLSTDEVGRAMGQAAQDSNGHSPDEVDVYARGHSVQPRTAGQREYIEAILHNDLTFCVGPAGTGKTYLAVAVAASLLKHGKVKRIVLARPAVEAGERLGFL